ncbi:Glycosyltransferase family 15 protein [Mycena indigotica]|uniref:Glycosyltransferase family 15 protein n=1 Tax=Mycena indigotica TaxID=2126181 RepID=A0A8H6SRW7_9AGAR|nr:Glycosyltransferase family 15 protein [Mycena indigotica]KAF7303772.1 Glycosyltransferase family 15 protein [Mycena indigotica]
MSVDLAVSSRNGQRSPSSYMHVLVPSDSIHPYEVIAEDTFDGLPPISCLEHQLMEEAEAELEGEENDDNDDEDTDAEQEAERPPAKRRSPELCSQRKLVDGEDEQLSEPTTCKRAEYERKDDDDDDDDIELHPPLKRSRFEDFSEESGFGVLHNCNGTLENKEHPKGVFACKGCSITFGRGSDLERHWRSIHLQKTWKCLAPECGSREEFSRKDSLFRHISVAHKEDSERLKALYRRREASASSG